MSSTQSKLKNLIFGLLVIQISVNLIGALGPELGFDALWYHLTEAKLFLARQSIAPIKGNLLYWSGLPRLAEIIFSLALSIWDERLPKLIHWLAGIISTWLIYKLARKKYSSLASITASLLFYSTLLVGWLSTTSYIDLIVTAIFLSAFYSQKQVSRVFYLILLGATKLTAVPLGLAVSWIPWALLGLLPFMVINYKATGNPVYPFLENLQLTQEYFFNGFWFWLTRPLKLFLDTSFRVGPVMLILLLFYFRSINWHYLKKPLLIVFFLWWLGPGTGFGRFSLPFLALLSISLASLFQGKLKKISLFLVILQASIGILGRGIANKKYLPVILGNQTKADFLANNLKFHFGDFYDIDGWFEKNLDSSQKVLIYGIHNLYYINFPYDHESWQDENTNYTHVLVGDNQPLPLKFSNTQLIYQNPTTRVKLYKLP